MPFGMMDDDDDLRAPTCRGLLKMLAHDDDGPMPSAAPSGGLGFAIFDESGAP